MKITFIPVYRVFSKRSNEWLLVKRLSTARLLHKPYNPQYNPQTVLIECAIVNDCVIVPSNVNQR